MHEGQRHYVYAQLTSAFIFVNIYIYIFIAVTVEPLGGDVLSSAGGDGLSFLSFNKNVRFPQILHCHARRRRRQREVFSSL